MRLLVCGHLVWARMGSEAGKQLSRDCQEEFSEVFLLASGVFFCFRARPREPAVFDRCIERFTYFGLLSRRGLDTQLMLAKGFAQ